MAADNEITSFMHCLTCMKDLPVGKSPQEWASLDVGFTKIGLQVWCNRCDKNVCHIDFEGHCHPADLNAPETKEGLH